MRISDWSSDVCSSDLLATYFGVSSALASGDLWVPTSCIHRSLEDLLRPRVPATTKTPVPLPRIPRLSADEWIAQKSAQLDSALLDTAHGLSGQAPLLFTGHKLRFPQGPTTEVLENNPDTLLAAWTYSAQIGRANV